MTVRAHFSVCLDITKVMDSSSLSESPCLTPAPYDNVPSTSGSGTDADAILNIKQINPLHQST